MRRLFCILCILAFQAAVGIDYLEPGTRLASPDSQWEVWVEKNVDTEDFTAAFYISPRGASAGTLIAQNCRHFGAEWSPNSKVLLVYNNLGSGTSHALIFQHTSKGWQQIYSTPEGFHVIWRLDKWLPGAVRLRSHAGGGRPDKVPPTVTVPCGVRPPTQISAPSASTTSPIRSHPRSGQKSPPPEAGH